MNTPTMLISFASVVLGGVSLTGKLPSKEGSEKGESTSVEAVSERSAASGIFYAPQGESLPVGVERLP